MSQLYVNLDHVATLRQVRRAPYPDILAASQLVASTGLVAGLTLHLREDRRHVQDDDVRRVRKTVELPFNFEMSCVEEIVLRCLEVAPAQATLVPERREELTTEGGLDLDRTFSRVRDVTRRLRDAGILVSLFIDPDSASVDRAKACGATHVEFHTGTYAERFLRERHAPTELLALERASAEARRVGLVVNAGHGLTVENVGPVARIPGMNDLNIGHALVARSLFVGLAEAVRELHRAMHAPL